LGVTWTATHTKTGNNIGSLLRIATHTKTGNNTGIFGTRTNNTTTHTKLKITLEASELKSITQQLTRNWEYHSKLQN
jgi:hypothetical protein